MANYKKLQCYYTVIIPKDFEALDISKAFDRVQQWGSHLKALLFWLPSFTLLRHVSLPLWPICFCDCWWISLPPYSIKVVSLEVLSCLLHFSSFLSTISFLIEITKCTHTVTIQQCIPQHSSILLPHSLNLHLVSR